MVYRSRQRKCRNHERFALLMLLAFAICPMVGMSLEAEESKINDHVFAGQIHNAIERFCGEIWPNDDVMPTKDVSNWEHYIVRRGECLSEIASLVCPKSYHDVGILLTANGLTNDHIRAGQVIRVPYFGYNDFVASCLFGARNDGEVDGLVGLLNRLDACRTGLKSWNAKLYYCRLALCVCHERNVSHSLSSNVLERTQRLVMDLDLSAGTNDTALAKQAYLELLHSCQEFANRGAHIQEYNYVPLANDKEFDENNRPIGDVADYIIRGDWILTAYRCDYPLRVNGVYPVFPLIKNMGDMMMWFPVIFDADERASLAKVRAADKKTGGWGFRNWRGEMFGDGSLWRDSDSKQVFAVNDVSRSIYEFWKRAYKRDLQTLAPQYRIGCRRAAYYFVSEDRAYFGRVDIMGNLWTTDSVYGPSHCNQARIMLFKREQKPSDIPWRVFNYDVKADTEHPHGRSADEIVSEAEDFSFSDYTNSGAPPDCPAMSLTFGSKTGRQTSLRLKTSDVWPPRK